MNPLSHESVNTFQGETILNTIATIPEAGIWILGHLCIVIITNNYHSKQITMTTAALFKNTSSTPVEALKKTGLDFSTIYIQFADKVYSKCLSMLKDEYLAEDLSQEIFMKIFMNMSRFENKSKFSTWVYAITHNSCVDFLRRKNRKKKLEALRKESVRLHQPEETPAFRLKEMKSKELHNIMKNISFSEEEILRMKYELGMSIKDIAQELGKTESAVKMKILRAKTKARKVKLDLFSKN